VQGQRLDQRATEMGSVPDRLRMFQRICEAVSFAHAHGVLHRDLKPQNVMVGPFGEVLVMDWGLSKLLNPGTGGVGAVGTPHAGMVPDGQTLTTNTAHGSVLGTPGFMAPEQARGDLGVVDQRADIYSLGEVLKFLVANAFPDRMPRALAAICNKASAQDVKARYNSVDDLANDVSRYLDGLPVSAYPESFFARGWRWAVRNSAWLLLVLAYVAMRALLIWWRGR
jgi:serine/threonine protein kinase